MPSKPKPPPPSRDERLEREGEWGSVQHAVRANHSMEALLWLDEQVNSKQASFDVLFRRMAAEGSIRNKEQFRALDAKEDIYEFKRGADRILAFRKKNTWYLTHHFRKSGQKCPPSQIERAKSIKSEHTDIYGAKESK